MEKISSIDNLRESIRLLEFKKATESTLLKEQLKITYASLRPASLIKSAFNQLTAAPDFKNGIVSTTVGLAAGLLSKKIAVGSTRNPLKQLFGTLLQMGVTSLVAKNTDKIKSAAIKLKDNVLSKKEASS